MLHYCSKLSTGDLDLAGETDGLHATISGPIETEGDAVINNRKNKLIPAYELEIKGCWSGQNLFLQYVSPESIVSCG